MGTVQDDHIKKYVNYIKVNHQSQLKFLLSVFNIYYNMVWSAWPSLGNNKKNTKYLGG
jgi:hypothetical protein